MGMFHPVYGELMTAKEVSEATGHTINQLRNWRVKSRQHLAPFGSILIGATSYYRQVVIQAWIDRNGRQDGDYFMTELDKEFPLNVSVEGDIKQRQATRLIASINPETVADAHEKLSVLNRPIVMRYANSVKNRFIEEELGHAPEDAITKDKRFANPVWFTAMTKAMRLAQNEIANLGFTEEEVLAIPVGQVPPLRETKFTS